MVSGQRFAQGHRRAGILKRANRGLKFLDDWQQPLPVVTRGDGHELEVLAMLSQHSQRTGADRAGCPEERNANHNVTKAAKPASATASPAAAPQTARPYDRARHRAPAVVGLNLSPQPDA